MAMASTDGKVHHASVGEATSSKVSAMDGINPTLAFAALFFGLSGNARDAANDQSAALEIEDGSGCPTLIVSKDPAKLPGQEMWAEEFWSTAARGSTSPDLIDRSWVETALIDINGSQPVAASEPVATVPAPWIDPCRPKP
jgi:hypothetical protein